MDKILSDIKKRVSFYLDNQGIKKSVFFTKTGISASNFKGAGGKSELGGDKIVKILTVFEDINPEWLLTGNGQMLREDAHTTQSIDTIIEHDDVNILVKYLLDNNKVLMQKELFRKYIKGNIRLIQLEEEKVKYDEEMKKLKEVILKKTK